MTTADSVKRIDSVVDEWETGPLARMLAKFPEQKQQFVTASGKAGRATLHAGRGDDRRVRSEARPSRTVSVHPRRAADDVSRPLLDDAAIRRFRHGRGVEPALPLSAGAGHDGPERGVRFADADRLRLGRRHGDRRGGQGGRGDRLARRHGDAVRRDSARQSVDQHDDQLDGRHSAGDVHRRRREAGRTGGQAQRHDSERHPQGVHRSRHLPLSARSRRCG